MKPCSAVYEQYYLLNYQKCHRLRNYMQSNSYAKPIFVGLFLTWNVTLRVQCTKIQVRSFTWNTPGEGRLGAPGPVPAYILGGGWVLKLEPALTRNWTLHRGGCTLASGHSVAGVSRFDTLSISYKQHRKILSELIQNTRKYCTSLNVNI